MAEPARDTRVVFEQTVDAMFFRVLKGRLTSRCRERVRVAGIDLDQKLKATYPREVWVACLKIVVEEQYGHLPAERAFWELGERMIESFRETMMGPAIVGMLRLLGPKRGLARFDQNFRYANNYNQTRLTERGPGDFELWVNETSVSPSFIGGTIAAVLRTAGAVNPKVEIAHFDGQACTYRIRF